MRVSFARRVDSALEGYFPERRVFLKSDEDTRFIRLKPTTQFLTFMSTAVVIAWVIVATAVILMDSIGSGNLREQAKRDQQNYETRLNLLAQQRDTRAAEAIAAQHRFNAALEQISLMQSDLLASETRRKEAEDGIEIIQKTLMRTMKEREEARARVDELSQQMTLAQIDGGSGELVNPADLDMMIAALSGLSHQRDSAKSIAEKATEDAESARLELALSDEQHDHIFRTLEEAMTVSVAPLDKMFRAAGMPTDRILEEVRRGYSGQGGPLIPLSMPESDDASTASTERANLLLKQFDQLNLYRIAAEQAPFFNPVQDVYRFTSPYGPRRDPKTGGRRMHRGVDFAARSGTPIYATGDGVVIKAGWGSAYGRLVKIKHAFGIETRYAHLSRIDVKVGQRVSRGERIGAMGATGRVTGVHLHYEVRVGGEAVNPMIYIKAANDVF